MVCYQTHGFDKRVERDRFSPISFDSIYLNYHVSRIHVIFIYIFKNQVRLEKKDQNKNKRPYFHGFTIYMPSLGMSIKGVETYTYMPNKL